MDLGRPAAPGPRPASRTRIELRLAPGTSTRSTRCWPTGRRPTCDFAFIDADKTSYDDYYERLPATGPPGGLIAIDNVLWSGAVLDEDTDDASTLALQALNAKLATDERISVCLLPVADGVTLARRR